MTFKDEVCSLNRTGTVSEITEYPIIYTSGDEE